MWVAGTPLLSPRAQVSRKLESGARAGHCIHPRHSSGTCGCLNCWTRHLTWDSSCTQAQGDGLLRLGSHMFLVQSLTTSPPRCHERMLMANNSQHKASSSVRIPPSSASPTTGGEFRTHTSGILVRHVSRTLLHMCFGSCFPEHIPRRSHAAFSLNGQHAGIQQPRLTAQPASP